MAVSVMFAHSTPLPLRIVPDGAAMWLLRRGYSADSRAGKFEMPVPFWTAWPRLTECLLRPEGIRFATRADEDDVKEPIFCRKSTLASSTR